MILGVCLLYCLFTSERERAWMAVLTSIVYVSSAALIDLIPDPSFLYWSYVVLEMLAVVVCFFFGSLYSLRIGGFFLASAAVTLGYIFTESWMIYEPASLAVAYAQALFMVINSDFTRSIDFGKFFHPRSYLGKKIS